MKPIPPATVRPMTTTMADRPIAITRGKEKPNKTPRVDWRPKRTEGGPAVENEDEVVKTLPFYWLGWGRGVEVGVGVVPILPYALALEARVPLPKVAPAALGAAAAPAPAGSATVTEPG